MTKNRLCLAGMMLGFAGFACHRTDAPEPKGHEAHSGQSKVSPASSMAVGGAGANEPAAHVAPATEASHAPGSHGDMPDGDMPAGHGDGAGGGAPAGYAAFTLGSERARAVGLRVAPVEERDFSKVLRTTGVVVLDETRTSHVHAKVRGTIESVSVDFVGKQVAAGAPLCTIYSQEVLAAELEFLSILNQTSTSAAPGPLADAEKGARDQLVSAARQRLALWDVPASEVARLESTRQARRTFTLDAPRSGIVVAKQALPGMFIDPSVELYLISDIRRLWVLADLYGSDVPGVKLGDHATLSVEGAVGASVPAEVAFLPPTVDEATRTLKVRFNLDNKDGSIRPGAFATIEMNLELGRSLAVPEAAVIHAGRQAIVFVAAGERIEPRSVTLGPLVGGYYSAQAGVMAGESVAVGAQFLIDSESRLRATSGKGPGHGGH
ncbi:MAG: efflux RND transporter periplasmic adaptor subunit [Deltaproteobacteria bacterium]